MENENTNVTPEEVTTEETRETFTAEELQAESDRRVTMAMKKRDRELAAIKREYEKKLENMKTLSQLDEENRAAAEKDMEIAELREKVKSFELTEAKNEVMKVLGARGLSTEFADMLVISTDSEEAQQMIDRFDKIYKRDVAREVKARIAETSAVPQIADAMSGKMTKEQFNKLSLAEQQAMYNSDPELVRQLLK